MSRDANRRPTRLSMSLFGIILGVSWVVLAQLHQGGAMGDMEMYSAAKIDGCNDFHCLTQNRGRCRDRTSCSRESGECGDPSCGHEHGGVQCHGGVLFYLRESAGFTDSTGRRSCVARAQNIASVLNRLMRMMRDHPESDSSFTVRGGRSGGNPSIWYTMTEGGHTDRVLEVTDSDLAGYRYRAGLAQLRDRAMPPELLDKEMVAKWWAYTLQDHFAMMAMNREPQLTTYTHCGKVLKTMWNRAREWHPEGAIPMIAWHEVAVGLSEQERAHLFLAAQIVPRNFDPERR